MKNEHHEVAEDPNQTFGAFIYDFQTNTVVRNKQKGSTGLRSDELGVSFNNSMSIIPMQFNSRELELRAHKLLYDTFKSPQPDEMTHEIPEEGNFSQFYSFRY